MKKILLFVLAAVLCVLGYVFLLSLMRGSPFELGVIIPALFIAVAAAVLNQRFLRSDGESLAALGFDDPARRVGQFERAFLAGCALVLGWAAILWFILSPRWQVYDGFAAGGPVGRIVFCLFNNAGEELVYRGYLLVKLAQRFGSVVAVLSTSAVFALLHVQAGVPLGSAFTAVLTSGILFAVLFLRWRSLPLVIGFHMATNVMQELLGLRLSELSIVQPIVPGTPGLMQQTALLGLTTLLILAVIFLVARGIPQSTWVGSRGRA